VCLGSLQEAAGDHLVGAEGLEHPTLAWSSESNVEGQGSKRDAYRMNLRAVRGDPPVPDHPALRSVPEDQTIILFCA
jgi:hypothetical protein